MHTSQILRRYVCRDGCCLFVQLQGEVEGEDMAAQAVSQEEMTLVLPLSFSRSVSLSLSSLSSVPAFFFFPLTLLGRLVTSLYLLLICFFFFIAFDSLLLLFPVPPPPPPPSISGASVICAGLCSGSTYFELMSAVWP